MRYVYCKRIKCQNRCFFGGLEEVGPENSIMRDVNFHPDLDKGHCCIAERGG